MIEDYETAKKLLLKYVYIFLALVVCIILMGLFYPDYYYYLDIIFENFYLLFISAINFIILVIENSFTLYSEVWFVLGFLVLFLGIFKIILEKSKIIK